MSMADNRELDDALDIDPLRPHEIVCPRCWLVYNAGLSDCPTPDCADR